ncbi:hypothetical protein MRX96_028223 [Rhipicephalus microplus]
MDVDGEPDNETLARDDRLQFSDLRPDERGMLLRARSASVVAYYDSSLSDDSPESSEEASRAVSGNEEDEAVEDLPSRLSNTNCDAKLFMSKS